MNIESKIADIIFFASVQNGFFDYNTSIKFNLVKFNENKSIELCPSCLEYLCYKIIKNRFLTNNFINSDIVLITEKFLSLVNNKNIFKLTNKQHIIIFIQGEKNKKWNLIIFPNLIKQINNCLNSKNKKIIVTNIITSNLIDEDENYILNKTFDKFEKIFDFKLPDVSFEVNLVNINDQKNTSIFLLNFIEGLICQNNDNITLYIQKLFDKDIYQNNNDQNNDYTTYFNSFNKINDIFENILTTYEKELFEYLKKNKDYEKCFNGNYIVMKNEIAQINAISNNENNNFEKGKNILGCNNGKCDDDYDSDFSSEDEEEALRIMEYQSKKSRQRKFIKNCPTYRLKLEPKNYKNIGIIKEEENESSSLSISVVKDNKNSKKFLAKLDYNTKNISREKKEELGNLDYNKKYIIRDNEINIKKTILKELEEAVNEFEIEQSLNNQTKKNKKEKKYKIIKSNTANLFINNMQRKKQKKNKNKKSADDKEKQRNNSTNKNFESSPNYKINYKKMFNDNIFKNFQIIHQKVKNFSVFKKNLIHPKDSNDLMQKLKRINMKNKALHGNNNIRKYDMDTNFKNKSFVIETDISKLLKAEIYRKGSNYKLTKKNKNNKSKNQKSKEKDENSNKTNCKYFKKYPNLISSTKLSSISQRSTLYKTEDSIKIIKQNKKQKKNIRIFEIEKENTNTLFNGKKILHPKEVKLNKIINKTKILDKNNYNSIKIKKKIKNNDNMIADNEESTMLNLEKIPSFEEFKANEKKNKIKINNISNKNGNTYFNRKLVNSNDNKKYKRKKISIQDYNVFEKNEQKECGCININSYELCNVF